MPLRHANEPEPLLEELASLRQEIRVLRDAVDELTEAVRWQNNNAEDYPALTEDRSRLWTLAHETLPALVNRIQFPALRSEPPTQ